MGNKTDYSRVPPYVSYATWYRLMTGLKEFVPAVIDSSVYERIGFSGSDTKKLRSALRFLNLVDENGAPSNELRSLVKAYQDDDNGTRPQLLQGILRSSYNFLGNHDFDLGNATWKQLEGGFDALGASRSTQGQCISFFLHLAGEAEMEISPHLVSKTKSGLGRHSAVLKSRKKRRQDGRRPDPLAIAEAPAILAAASMAPADPFLALDIEPAIASLLRLLPHKGEKWAKAEQDRFMNALANVIAAFYPCDNA